VVRARQKELDRTVILKLMEVGEDLESDEATRARREAQVLADLHHPGIVQLLDYEVAPPWISLAYPDDGGVALQHHPEKASWAQAERLRRLLSETLEGLGAAHEAGILHRDIKPGNLLAYPDGTVKWIDFGLALATDETRRLTRTGLFLGTPLYASPEQVGGIPLAPTADLYSLGLLVYELAVGTHPLKANDLGAILHKQLMVTPPPLREQRPDLPGKLTDLVDALIKKDPAERPASAAEALEWLRAPEPTPVEPPSRKRSTAALPPPQAPRPETPPAPPTPSPAPPSRARTLALVLLAGAAGYLLRGVPGTPERHPPGSPSSPASTPAPAAFDLEAWADQLPRDWARAESWYVAPDGGLMRSLDGSPPDGAVRLTRGLPYLLERQYQEIPALRRAREALASGFSFDDLDQEQRERIREAEAPLREAGVPAPFGPLLEVRTVPEDRGRDLPADRWTRDYRDLEGSIEPWVGAMFRYTEELVAEIGRVDALLEGPPLDVDAPYYKLQWLLGVRRVIEHNDRRPTLQLATLALAFERERDDFYRLTEDILLAYRRVAYCALRAMEASPREAPQVAVALYRLADWISALVDAAIPQIPEELLGGRLPRRGPGALVCGYLYSEYAKRHHVAARILEHADPGLLTRAETRCVECLDAARADPTDHTFFRTYLYSSMWNDPSHWITTEHRRRWIEDTVTWLRSADPKQGSGVLRRMIVELGALRRLDPYRARLGELRVQEALIEDLGVDLHRHPPEERGHVLQVFPELAQQD
jgi:serine/threonine protein kinase